MCDGGYDGGGYSDPDYYDLEFRQQNPDVYGNDEYMQDYYGSYKRVQQNRQTQRPDYSRTEADRQFHEEYLRYRRNHPDKIAFFREKSKVKHGTDSNTSNEGIPIWMCIVGGFIIYPLIIMEFIDACSN